MSYRLTALIAEDPGFRARVRACLLDVARDVANENWTSPATDTTEGGTTVDASFNRTARIALAYTVAATPTAVEVPFAWICAASPLVLTAATVDADGALVIDETAGKADDAALKYLVAGSWDRVGRFYAARPGALT